MSVLRIITIMTFLLLAGWVSAQSASGSDGYEVVRQDEKITMYERWTPYPGTTTNSRHIKCVFYAKSDPANMFAHIYEEAKIKAWQENILEYVITPRNDTTWVAYSHYRIPWPLANQDYLLTYVLHKKSDKKIVVSFTHLEDQKLGPVRKGVDRRPTIGKWEFEKFADGKTKVIYTITSLPLSTPRFITDRIVHNNLMSTIKKLIVVAEK